MTTTTATAATAAATTTAAGGALSKASGDFNMFLKLLTTQMQNQDPLKPMDSAEYTQQLAQFSQVEQSLKQSAALGDILAQLTTQNISQASSFIGRTATFDTDVAGLSTEAPAHWHYDAPVGTQSLTATVVDASGRTVATATLDPAVSDFAWDGTKADGNVAPPGTYTLKIEGTNASGADVVVDITSIGKVRDVNGGAGGVTLGVNGAQLPLSQLKRVAAGT